VRVLALSGSLRRGSYNTTLLGAAASAAPIGMAFERFDRLADLPPYDEDLDFGEGPASVRALRDAIAAADGLLIATPEYNGSIPGHLKTAIDWASRPTGAGALAGKPVAVIGASIGSFAALSAQADLRKVLRVAGARVLPDGVAIAHADRAFDDHGRPRQDSVSARLRRLLCAVAAEPAIARRLAASAGRPRACRGRPAMSTPRAATARRRRSARARRRAGCRRRPARAPTRGGTAATGRSGRGARGPRLRRRG
jgi:chromate reductase